LESSNYSAPGADRLKLTAVLEARAYDDPEDLPNFTTLFTIKNGTIQTYNQRTQYSILKDELAKRTFDESGDYYVSGLDVELRENADTGTNGGLVPASRNPDANLISVRVNPGTAYVKGYEVGIIRPEYLVTPKSTNYVNVNSQIVSAFMGSYVTANNMVGHLELDEGKSISLLDTFNRRISNGRFAGWGGFITLYTDTAERMRIRNNGNIIIGATADAGYKLDVNGTARVQGAFTATLASVSIANVVYYYSSTGLMTYATTPIGAQFVIDYDYNIVGSKNGSNVLFTTSATFIVTTTRVFLNGQRLTRGAGYDYIETGTNQITFTNPPVSTDLIIIEYQI